MGYPLSVDIQSSNFTAQVVSQQGQKDGMGSLAAGFEMKLNDLGPNDPFEFILGAILKIGVSWGMPDSDGLLDSLSFWLDSCRVTWVKGHLRRQEWLLCKRARG